MFRLLLTLVVFLLPALARAQDEDAYEAIVEVEAMAAATNDVDATASGTEIDATRSIAADESVQQLLLRIPGTHVARSGGPGAFTTLSLRGAEFAHTTVMLGDVPLAGPDAGPVDLSLLPVGAFSRLEVYRGGAPAWFDTGAIGGVLRLVPRTAELSRVTAGTTAGSFGTWGADVSADLVHRDTDVAAVVGMDGSDGDYRYVDDNATAFDPNDDRQRTRQNADTLGAHGAVSLRHRTRNGRVHAVALASSRRGGEPGAGATRALHARRQVARVFGATAYTHHAGDHRLQLVVGGGEERRQLDDRRGEVGFGQELTDDRIDAAFVRAAARIAAARFLTISTVLQTRVDAYRPEDALGPEQANAMRTTASGTLEARLAGKLGRTLFELRPSARLERSRTDIEAQSDGVTSPTMRLGALVAPRSWIAFSASVSRGRRVPTLLELFGDRGALVASPSLRPETGRTIDAGVVVRGRVGMLASSLELRAFALRAEDLIRWVPTSQYTAAARNVDEARVRGFESGTRGRLGTHLEWSAVVTAMRTDDGGGRELNWRPRVHAHVQPEVHTRRFGNVRDLAFFAALHHRAGFYNDPANFVRVEPGTWIDVGARLDLDLGLSFAFTARDVFDQRGRDFVGYPLPGRRFAARLQYQKDFD